MIPQIAPRENYRMVFAWGCFILLVNILTSKLSRAIIQDAKFTKLISRPLND